MYWGVLMAPYKILVAIVMFWASLGMFGGRTAHPSPRNSPCGPSFFKMTLTPWKTPLYNRGASLFALSSPWSCNLGDGQRSCRVRGAEALAYRILTVSKPWVTVTAPHAAIPPAMKELVRVSISISFLRLQIMPKNAHPSVVDMVSLYATALRKPETFGRSCSEDLGVCCLLPRDHGHQE
jgi:hypothetical protein